MSGAVISTFDKIQSQYATDYSCTCRTCVSDNGCTKIFFSSFNTLSLSLSLSLSLNDNNFFIVIRLCCRVGLRTCKPDEGDMFSAEVKPKTSNRKQQRRKEVNFRPISFEIQLPEATFKPISIADRNVVRQAEFCIPNFAGLVSLVR